MLFPTSTPLLTGLALFGLVFLNATALSTLAERLGLFDRIDKV